MAPEVMMGGEITEKVDVYSFGVLLWEILCCKEAYGNHTNYETFYKAVCLNHERPEVPPHCPPKLRQLMDICWQHDPQSRPSMEEIVPLIGEAIDECKSAEREEMLNKTISDPVARNFWKTYFLMEDEVRWSEFAKALYENLLKLPLPVDPTDTPLPDNATEADLRMASKPQLLGFAKRTENCKIMVDRELERRRRELADGYQPSAYVATDYKQSISDESRALMCLKVLVAPEDTVSMSDFGKLAGWFGPVTPADPSGESLGFLDRIVDLLRQPWFHGSIGTRDAENTLKIFPRGTYLVRFSNSHPNSFVISKVSAERIIKHVVIPYTPNKGFKLDGHYFHSLQELIPRCSSKYFLKTPCPGSKYTWLFEEDVANVGGYGD